MSLTSAKAEMHDWRPKMTRGSTIEELFLEKFDNTRNERSQEAVDLMFDTVRNCVRTSSRKKRNKAPDSVLARLARKGVDD